MRQYDEQLEAEFPIIFGLMLDCGYLITKEVSPVEQYHIQGYTTISDKKFCAMQRALLTEQHQARKADTRCRLCWYTSHEDLRKGYRHVTPAGTYIVVATTMSEEELSDVPYAVPVTVPIPSLAEVADAIREQPFLNVVRQMPEAHRVIRRYYSYFKDLDTHATKKRGLNPQGNPDDQSSTCSSNPEV